MSNATRAFVTAYVQIKT